MRIVYIILIGLAIFFFLCGFITFLLMIRYKNKKKKEQFSNKNIIDDVVIKPMGKKKTKKENVKIESVIEEDIEDKHEDEDYIF